MPNSCPSVRLLTSTLAAAISATMESVRPSVPSGPQGFETGGANGERQNGHLWSVRASRARHVAHMVCPHSRVAREAMVSQHILHEQSTSSVHAGSSAPTRLSLRFAAGTEPTRTRRRRRGRSSAFADVIIVVVIVVGGSSAGVDGSIPGSTARLSKQLSHVRAPKPSHLSSRPFRQVVLYGMSL